MSLPPISAPLQETVDKIVKIANADRYEAFNYCEAGLALARAQHDDAAFIAIALQYGLVMDQHGYPDESINTLYEALQLTQSYHQFADEARLLNVIGRAVYTRAEYSRAMQAWGHCLEVAELAEDQISWIWAKVGIAQIYDALEDNTTAVVLLKQAEERARPLNDKILLLNILLNLGVDLFHIHEYDQALLAYHEAIDLARQLNHLDDIGETLFRIAEVDLAQERLDVAFAHLHEAEVICTQSHHMWALANIHGVRARIYALQSRLDEALVEVQKGLDYAHASGSSHIEMRLLFLQAELAERGGNAILAFRAYRAATGLREKIRPDAQHHQLIELEDLAGVRPSPGRVLLELANNSKLESCELNELAQLLCDNAALVIKGASASYWQYLPDDQLFYRVYGNTPGLVVSSKQSFGEQLAWSLQQGETTIAHNAQHHQRTWDIYDQLFRPAQIVSVMMLPLRLNTRLFGVLMIEQINQPKNWSADEVQSANQLAIIGTRALANIERHHFQTDIARLNAQLQQNNAELEARVLERTVELQKAMEHLVETEKLASLGNLVAGFAHELNTPLGNTLTAATTLLAKNQELLDQINHGQVKKTLLLQYLEDSSMIAELVERNARRASNLISNLKQVAVDKTSSKQRVFNLHQIIEETISTMSISLKHRKIQINNLVPPEIELDSYPGSLEQVIGNFITNTLVHGYQQDEEGQIEISASQLDASQIELRYQDHGAGIPHHIKKRVFEPFFTTRFGQGGSGLGLYLVYSLVNGTLGGVMELLDAPEGGALFVLTLPIQAPAEHHDSINLLRH